MALSHSQSNLGSLEGAGIARFFSPVTDNATQAGPPEQLTERQLQLPGNVVQQRANTFDASANLNLEISPAYSENSILAGNCSQARHQFLQLLQDHGVAANEIAAVEENLLQWEEQIFSLAEGDLQQPHRYIAVTYGALNRLANGLGLVSEENGQSGACGQSGQSGQSGESDFGLASILDLSKCLRELSLSLPNFTISAETCGFGADDSVEYNPTPTQVDELERERRMYRKMLCDFYLAVAIEKLTFLRRNLDLAHDVADRQELEKQIDFTKRDIAYWSTSDI